MSIDSLLQVTMVIERMLANWLQIAPTFIAVVQMWYRRKEQTTRNASWYAMLGVVNMVKPPHESTT